MTDSQSIDSSRTWEIRESSHVNTEALFNFSFLPNPSSRQDYSFKLCILGVGEGKGRWGRLSRVGGRLIARFPRVIEKAFYYNLIDSLMPKMFP